MNCTDCKKAIRRRNFSQHTCDQAQKPSRDTRNCSIVPKAGLSEAAHAPAFTFRDNDVGQWLLDDDYFKRFLNLKANRGNLQHGQIGNDLKQRLRWLGELALLIENYKQQKISLIDVFNVDHYDLIVKFVQDKSSPNERLKIGPACGGFLN